eukprot:TRINITY_DN1_c0_g1_i2.p1 TRINITY_DN1_c0_g1~~TRINITY_DN1_c0_g1_i2.p1  ORF type:complete len:197 (-),score=-58.50 TRINITY_DN1_c0_g1_i2:257-847(-)
MSLVHSNTRARVRLLGPCYKTGRQKPSKQDRRSTLRLVMPYFVQTVRRRPSTQRFRHVKPHLAIRMEDSESTVMTYLVGLQRTTPDTHQYSPALRPPQYDTLLPLPFQRFQVFQLSFQSSFHLSFTVLVRYRFPINIQPQKKFISHLGLQSQTTRLYANRHTTGALWNGAFTLFGFPFQGNYTNSLSSVCRFRLQF